MCREWRIDRKVRDGDGRNLVIWFSLSQSSRPLSFVPHNPEGVVEGDGQHRTGIPLFLFGSPLPLKLISNVARYEQGPKGWGTEQCRSQD